MVPVVQGDERGDCLGLRAGKPYVPPIPAFDPTGGRPRWRDRIVAALIRHAVFHVFGLHDYPPVGLAAVRTMLATGALDAELARAEERIAAARRRLAVAEAQP